MKAHHFSIIIAVIMMVLFVQPNKVNKYLKTDEVIDKVEESHEGIQNFVQNTSLSSSLIRRKNPLISNDIAYRLEHRKMNGSTFNYLSGSKKFIDKEMVSCYSFYIFYRMIQDILAIFQDSKHVKNTIKTKKTCTKKLPTIDYSLWENKPRTINVDCGHDLLEKYGAGYTVCLLYTSS